MLRRYQQHQVGHIDVYGDFPDKKIHIVDRIQDVDRQVNTAGKRLLRISHRRLIIHVVEATFAKGKLERYAAPQEDRKRAADEVKSERRFHRTQRGHQDASHRLVLKAQAVIQFPYQLPHLSPLRVNPHDYDEQLYDDHEADHAVP